jgi:hypothetical protein
VKSLLLLLISLLLLAQGPVRAQATPAAVADSLADIARTDTSIALQRLFVAQRRAGRTRLILGAIVVASSSVLLAGTHPETTYQRISGVGLGLASGYYAYQLIDGLVQLRRFRAQRENQVLENLENGQPLPRWVRRKLKSSYFSAKVTAY